MTLQFAILRSGRPIAAGQLQSASTPPASQDRTADEIQAEIELTLARMRADNIDRLRRDGPGAVLDLS